MTDGPEQSPAAVPPIRVGLPHDKLDRLVLTVMEFPAVPVAVAVTVTKFVLAAALTPTELPLPTRLMAATRFVAKTVVDAGAFPDQ